MQQKNNENLNQITLSGQKLEEKSEYIIDYISGQKIKALPEEIDAVQIFSKRLVEEFGYPRAHIQTKPQFRIKASPSGDELYSIDIAVFSNDKKTYNNLFMIVECKRKNRLEGLNQLQIYLGLSSAQIGVWFNGQEHIYLQKILNKEGSIIYRELPNIPTFGQRIEDIGKFKRKDLKPPINLKATFRDIRNHLAGMTTGITRDETLAQEIINLLFCKIYDEINTAPNEQVKFRAGVDEPPEQINQRIIELFEKNVKIDYSDVFDKKDVILLDKDSIRYVVGELQNYCITEAQREAIGDAFEVFIGPALRGAEGQFFTPRNVVKMIVDVLDPSPRDFIIDPACGTGGFLIVAIEHIWKKLEEEGKRKNWSSEILAIQKREIASKYFRGIDKDSFLAKVTKAYMAIVGDGRGGIFCENSLKNPKEWSNSAQEKIQLNKFEIVITNPPHGAKIPVKGEEILEQYNLSKVWKKDKTKNDWFMTNKIRSQQSPQVLFLERCLQLLKPGGRMAIILPESLLGNPSHGYVVTYLRKNAKIIGLVSMPEELFQPHTHNKTCVLFVQKEVQKNDDIMFMSIVKWCGHDSRGNPIPYDEIPLVSSIYHSLYPSSEKNIKDYNRLGFIISISDFKNNILIPKYYNPDIEHGLNELSQSHDLVTVQNLIDKKIISIGTGVEIGKLSYGTGTVPFIRTSDISNWELKIDPKHGINEEIYQKYSKKTSVKENDILLVRDGSYLIGTSCMITKYDTKILFQSHIYRLRVLKPEILSPFLLFALLNTPIVKMQIRAKQFTQDIIDTLGGRITEIILPIPKENNQRDKISYETKRIVTERSELRQKAKKILIEIASIGKLSEEEEELSTNL